MFKSLLLLVSVIALWVVALWLSLPDNGSQLSPPRLLLLYTLPPLLLSAGIHYFWNGRQKRRQRTRDMAEQQQQQQQQATQASARAQHQAAIKARQQTLRCHWLWVAAKPKTTAILDHAGSGAGYWHDIDGDDEMAAARALYALYHDSPGAAWLPHWLLPHQSTSPEQQQAQWQATIQQAAAALAAPVTACHLLADGDDLQPLLEQLQQDPTLPGLVLLCATAPEDVDQSMVAMLLLREDLPALAPSGDEQDDMPKAYWDKVPATGQTAWEAVPAAMRAGIAALPCLARLYRGASGDWQAKDKLGRLTRQLHTLLGDALINAGLRDAPFADDAPAPQPDPAIAWLVHDCDRASTARLAALASILPGHDIELTLPQQASAQRDDWRDSGGSLLACACAIRHSHRLHAPVLLARLNTLPVRLAIIRPGTDWPHSENPT